MRRRGIWENLWGSVDEGNKQKVEKAEFECGMSWHSCLEKVSLFLTSIFSGKLEGNHKQMKSQELCDQGGVAPLILSSNRETHDSISET